MQNSPRRFPLKRMTTAMATATKAPRRKSDIFFRLPEMRVMLCSTAEKSLRIARSDRSGAGKHRLAGPDGGPNVRGESHPRAQKAGEKETTGDANRGKREATN
jgi:hypothetical protein